MTQKIAFQLENVQVRRGERFCLSVEQLQIFPHETLALIGPTGAGKSTLLHLLTGLITPSSGEVRFSATPCPLPLELRRKIVLVPQQPKFLQGSVFLNLEYGLILRGIKLASAVLLAWLDKFHLAEFASQSANTLSGGQRQMLSLARALIIPAEVYLLDEPTANLDPASVACVEQILRETQAARHLTYVLATHQWFQARRLSQRTALIIEGKLIEIQETEKLFEQPDNDITQSFLQGKMVF